MLKEDKVELQFVETLLLNMMLMNKCKMMNIVIFITLKLQNQGLYKFQNKFNKIQHNLLIFHQLLSSNLNKILEKKSILRNRDSKIYTTMNKI